MVNFFRVLRDRPDELIRKIRLTPWARDEFEICFNLDCDEVENARRFFVRGWMVAGRSPLDPTTGMRFNADFNADYKVLYHDDLQKIIDRLVGVQIENRDWRFVFSSYDRSETLTYFDPPYVHETRTTERGYAFEWSDSDHAEAATLLRRALGYVIVSGYACPLYTELYEVHGWQRHDKESQTNSGGKRIESIWLSPRTAEALSKPKQVALW